MRTVNEDALLSGVPVYIDEGAQWLRLLCISNDLRNKRLDSADCWMQLGVRLDELTVEIIPTH